MTLGRWRVCRARPVQAGHLLVRNAAMSPGDRPVFRCRHRTGTRSFTLGSWGAAVDAALLLPLAAARERSRTTLLNSSRAKLLLLSRRRRLLRCRPMSRAYRVRRGSGLAGCFIEPTVKLLSPKPFSVAPRARVRSPQPAVSRDPVAMVPLGRRRRRLLAVLGLPMGVLAVIVISRFRC